MYDVKVTSAHASFNERRSTIGAQGTFTYTDPGGGKVCAKFVYESRFHDSLQISDAYLFGEVDAAIRSEIARTIKETAKAEVRTRVTEFIQQQQENL